MINVKEKMIKIINTLPDNTTWEEAMYALYLNSKIRKSEDDIENNRVLTLEESQERMKNKYEGFDIK